MMKYIIIRFMLCLKAVLSILCCEIHRVRISQEGLIIPYPPTNNYPQSFHLYLISNNWLSCQIFYNCLLNSVQLSMILDVSSYYWENVMHWKTEDWSAIFHLYHVLHIHFCNFAQLISSLLVGFASDIFCNLTDLLLLINDRMA